MIGEMAISVVIPSFNREKLLGRALASVRGQSLQPQEIIVVDDGSKPGTLEKLKDVYSEVLWLHQHNQGVAAARNLGIRKSKQPWIALLDSDDEWEPEKLKLQMQFIHQYKDIRAVHTGEKWIRSGNEVIPPAYLDKSAELLWERSLANCLICPSSALLHRSVFNEIGYFDEKLLACEDYDFWLRLLIQMPIGLVEQKMVLKHGGHSDQLSTTTWGMDRFRVQALQKLLDRKDIEENRRTLLRETLIRKCKILEQGAHKRNKQEEAISYAKLREKYTTSPLMETA